LEISFKKWIHKFTLVFKQFHYLQVFKAGYFNYLKVAGLKVIAKLKIGTKIYHHIFFIFIFFNNV